MADERRSIVALRATRERASAESWALVLTAAGIGCRVAATRGVWKLWVVEDDAARALQQLEAYERENAPRPAPPPPAPEYGSTPAGYLVAAGLVLFFAFTGSFDRSVPWHEAGAADAEAVLGGEIWRVVTALTLHADAGHILANAISAAVFATLVFRALGPGVGGWLILLAGAFGNWLNAWTHGAGHVSIGASTALFGAVGVLCGLEFGRLRRLRVRRRAAWLPLAAGLGLLAMMGVAGGRTDVSAHVFGLLCGIPLGALAPLGPATQRRPLQWTLAAAALAAVVVAWSLALSAWLPDP